MPRAGTSIIFGNSQQQRKRFHEDVADKIPAFRSDVTLPLEEAFSSGRELAKGCTFFIALVGTLSVISSLTLLISDRAQGRAVLLFSGAVWLLWIGLRAAQRLVRRDNDTHHTKNS